MGTRLTVCAVALLVLGMSGGCGSSGEDPSLSGTADRVEERRTVSTADEPATGPSPSEGVAEPTPEPAEGELEPTPVVPEPEPAPSEPPADVRWAALPPADDPGHPANRVSRWRGSLAPECERNVRELAHDSGRYVLAWVDEGTGDPGENECAHPSGIVATAHGTAPFQGGCTDDPGQLGDLDGDSNPDLLFLYPFCAAGGCPCVPVLFRDPDTGPVSVDVPAPAGEAVSEARWYEREGAPSGVELRVDDWDRGPFDPPPAGPPVRFVWQDDHLAPAP